MTAVQKTRIRIAAFAVAAGALLVPVTLTSDSAVEVNEACADGSCCMELNSICDSDGDLVLHYYNGDKCTAEIK